MPFSGRYSTVNNRKSLGHRPVDPRLSRRVSQGHPAGVPGIFLKFMCPFLSWSIEFNPNNSRTAWNIWQKANQTSRQLTDNCPTSRWFPFEFCSCSTPLLETPTSCSLHSESRTKIACHRGVARMLSCNPSSPGHPSPVPPFILLCLEGEGEEAGLMGLCSGSHAYVQILSALTAKRKPPVRASFSQLLADFSRIFADFSHRKAWVLSQN